MESIWPRERGDFIHVAGVPEGVKSCRDLSLTLQFARFESNQGTNYITSDAFLSVLSRYLFPPSYRKSSKGNTVHHGLCAITRETCFHSATDNDLMSFSKVDQIFSSKLKLNSIGIKKLGSQFFDKIKRALN